MDPLLELYSNSLFHEGVLRKSGRYPWGSGSNPYQRSKGFLQYVDDLKKAGVSETNIAKGLALMTEDGKFSTSDLRAAKTIAHNTKKAEDIRTAQKLKEKGLSNVKIGEAMGGLNESSVRDLLNPSKADRNAVLNTTADMLRGAVKDHKYIDFGEGNERHIGVSREKLNTAVSMLKEEGYEVHYLKVEQQGTGKQTSLKILAAPGTPWKEVNQNQDQIRSLARANKFSEDGGRTFTSIKPPKSFSADRVAVRWGDEGGTEKDGVIELRRGVDELSLGNARYAQVRVMVNGTHYLKGMAMYSDNIPDGADMVFNTNKSKKADKLDAMKPIKDDPDLPFGSIVRQREYIDKNGKRQLSPLNIVGTEKEGEVSISGEEGAWNKWSKNLSSQMLSKQPPNLAKQQLGLTYAIKLNEFEDIQSLTNPAVKRLLLEKFADGADSSAVHLKAAGLPRTAAHVILPINSLKDNEVYAPQYNNGEKVVLIRHPHGGIFEIPELTVNNRNREANSVIKQAKDAVGINAKVAAQLSGADFDGDTVLVIPNNNGQIKTKRPLAGLKDFDTRASYPPFDGMKTIDGGTWNGTTKKVDYGPKGPSGKAKQTAMGDVSNLITDMTIKDAPESEIAKAVRHSMVVIDAEKHSLNWRQSAIDNDIPALKTKYQGKSNAGASTLVSRASSDIRPDARKDRGIDPITGKRLWEYTGETYVRSTVNSKGEVVEKVVKKKAPKSTKMAEVDDAYQLIDGVGQPIERVYADHANKLKALANNARKASIAVKPTPISRTAKEVYSDEVKTLRAKLNVALMNAPLERDAQLLAKSMVSAKKQANPGMDRDEEKKIKAVALTEARRRIGAGKVSIDITPREWDAIQAGAISTNQLNQILANTNIDLVKQYATPREKRGMSPAQVNRAKSMLAGGYTQAEIANALGVPTSTLNDSLE